ncbi:MAG: MbcA/ParS/Xre antitoxin family protein [Peptococcaceae bacterium]|nr:MbcA/ParS/Xre antitoxin family protein [Peptococcaceae bacterium]
MIIFLEQYRWRKTGQMLRLKLGEFAADPQFADEIARAQQLYFVGLDPDFIDENDDIIMERCFEWFIFDYVMENGQTLIDMYRTTKSTSDMEQKMLGEWSSARLSVFEVYGFSSEKGLKIRDLLLNRKLTVKNYSVNGKLDRGSIIFMRVLKVGSEYEFSTGGFALPDPYGKFLMEKIRTDIDRYITRKGKDSFSLENYLQEKAHKINTWVMDLALKAVRLSNDDVKQNPGQPGINISSRIAQRITDLFLDDYYEKWINQPVQALGGKTPRESCKTVHGRAKVEEILKKLEIMEQNRIKKGEPHYDINKVRVRLGLIPGDYKSGADKNRLPAQPNDWQSFPWSNHVHARIALFIKENLIAKNYSASQIEGALKLWFDYCAKENPSIRKEQLWVAVVIYTLGRLEFDDRVQQHKLAEEYGVSPSSLSAKFRSMCRSLDLVIFDRRYISGKSPIEELELSDPLLARILYKLKL